MFSPLTKVTAIMLLSAVMSQAATAQIQLNFEDWAGQAADQSKRPNYYYPRTIEQVVDVVKAAAAAGTKIRISGAKHSWNSVVLSDNSTYLSTTQLNHVVGFGSVDSKPVVTVESGMMLGDLEDYLNSKGYSIGFAMPEFRGLTVGGLVATGSHGSSRRFTGISAQLVKSLEMVTATGEVIHLAPRDGDKFKAATVNLGSIGVVTKLTLSIVPRFNLRVTSSVMDVSQQSLPDFVNGNPQEDFLFVAWFPGLHKAILESGEMTFAPADVGAENVIFGLTESIGPNDYHIVDALTAGRADPTGAVEKQIEAMRFAGLTASPRFVVLQNGKDVPQHVVVGSANKMTLARGAEIVWPYKLNDYSFTFPASQLSAVMATIQQFSDANHYSFPNAGISMRFLKSDGGKSSLLSHIESKDSKAGELFVSAEFLEFRAYDAKGMPTGPREQMRQDLLDLLVKQYHVRFHMGKNNDQILQSEPAYSSTYGNYQRFIGVMNEMDPKGMFTSDFVKNILQTRSSTPAAGN